MQFVTGLATAILMRRVNLKLLRLFIVTISSNIKQENDCFFNFICKILFINELLIIDDFFICFLIHNLYINFPKMLIFQIFA